MKYKITVQRETAPYTYDSIAELEVLVPDYVGIEAMAADAVTIVATSAISAFSDGIASAIAHLGKEADRRPAVAESAGQAPAEPEPDTEPDAEASLDIGDLVTSNE
jgi:hypothetical protein